MTHWFILFDVEYCYAVSPLPACSCSALSVWDAYWRAISPRVARQCASPCLLTWLWGCLSGAFGGHVRSVFCGLDPQPHVPSNAAPQIAEGRSVALCDSGAGSL